VWAVALIAASGWLLRVWPFWRYGDAWRVPVDYDGGVYFPAVALLTWGVLPYRDFAFVHPPGIFLFHLPSGALTHLVDPTLAFTVSLAAPARSPPPPPVDRRGALLAIAPQSLAVCFKMAGRSDGNMWKLGETIRQFVSPDQCLLAFEPAGGRLPTFSAAVVDVYAVMLLAARRSNELFPRAETALHHPLAQA
jgi:hypothetical protein